MHLANTPTQCLFWEISPKNLGLLPHRRSGQTGLGIIQHCRPKRLVPHHVPATPIDQALGIPPPSPRFRIARWAVDPFGPQEVTNTLSCESLLKRQEWVPR